MKIYLMRHGEASFDAKTDDDRELTEAGRLRIQHNLQAHLPELMGVQTLLSSPIRRAWQTAEIAQVLLKRDGKISAASWLRHESRPANAISQLATCDFRSVMLFSHQPFASQFAEMLCGLEAGAIQMNTASILAMEAEVPAAGLAHVAWYQL